MTSHLPSPPVWGLPAIPPEVLAGSGEEGEHARRGLGTVGLVKPKILFEGVLAIVRPSIFLLRLIEFVDFSGFFLEVSPASFSVFLPSFSSCS